jgi:hypothetical protein
VGGKDAHGGQGYVSVGDSTLFQGEEGEPWMVEINCCLLDGCLLSLSNNSLDYERHKNLM